MATSERISVLKAGDDIFEVTYRETGKLQELKDSRSAGDIQVLLKEHDITQSQDDLNNFVASLGELDNLILLYENAPPK